MLNTITPEQTLTDKIVGMFCEHYKQNNVMYMVMTSNSLTTIHTLNDNFSFRVIEDNLVAVKYPFNCRYYKEKEIFKVVKQFLNKGER